MAKDPVCRMTVQENSAAKLEHEGQIYYFCSDDCKSTFQADPAKYSVKAMQAMEDDSMSEHSHHDHRGGCC